MCSASKDAAAAASAPESTMISMRPFRGGVGFVRLAAVAAALLLAPAAMAAAEFPFDQEMILDAKRIGGLRRLPIVTVEPNGNAVIDLWCKTVPARVQFSDSAIKIETAPLPEALPGMMVAGQCSPERLQADQDLLAALTQVTEWRRQGSAVVLNGPTVLRFHASSH